MVDLETAIKELKTGIIEFVYPTNSGCTTEGEMILLLEELKRLQEEVNPWIPYPDIWPEEEGMYWITYISKDIEGNQMSQTEKVFYSKTYHAFMGYNNSVIAWKYDIPYKEKK